MPTRRAIFTFVLLCTMATGAALAQSVTVQQGDTLWSIANHSGTTVTVLKELNDLTSDSIRVGQVLRLPSSDDGAEAVEVTTVVVRPGDTLYDIALAHGVTVTDLVAFNDLDGFLIHPGMELKLVVGERELEPLTISVSAGDSLWSLARNFDTTVALIASANSISTSAVIRPGDRLVIPGQYASAGQDRGGAVPETITVQRGDSLWAIASAHNTSVAAIMSANNLNSDRLVAGQMLRILPGSEVSAGRAVADVPRAPVVNSAGLIWPIDGVITSRFGYRSLRISGSNFHTGLDIDGQTGDPIHAATGGTVTHSGWQGGYGYLVIVENGDNLYYYAHASALLVNEGDRVETGQVLARVGSTGNSTGSHLHFEVRVAGDPVDPLPLLQAAAGR